MKQLTIISGKGGTGKTSITAAFASLAKNTVFADCDVDAADLHLIFKPSIQKTMPFYGLEIASIDPTICNQCKNCISHCQFEAISTELSIIKEACEGCKVCAYVCPVNAISMKKRNSGNAYISNSRFGPFVHAALHTAEEASGKLVTMVREHAKKIAKENQNDFIIIDGPPGIGCPVIASITGVDVVLIVTEPTLSAIHDLKRVQEVSNHFHIPPLVCINKYDINMENTKEIETFCQQNHIPIVGKIDYDTSITKAMIHQQNIIEFAHNTISKQIKDMWINVHQVLMQE